MFNKLSTYILSGYVVLGLAVGVAFAESQPNATGTVNDTMDQQSQESVINQTSTLKDEQWSKKEEINSDDELFNSLRTKSPGDIFKEANRAYQEKDYELAIQTYNILNGLYPFSEYAEQSRFAIIESHYHHPQMDEVILAADKFISLYPNSTLLESVYRLRGLAYLNDKNKTLALFNYIFNNIDFSQRVDANKLAYAAKYLNDYLKRFPNGKYKEEITESFKELNKLIALKEINIIDFYFKREQYLAVYNRITQLFERYPVLSDIIDQRKIKQITQQYHDAQKQLLLI